MTFSNDYNYYIDAPAMNALERVMNRLYSESSDEMRDLAKAINAVLDTAYSYMSKKEETVTIEIPGEAPKAHK